MDSRCQLCGLEGESVNYVFLSCTIARQIWALSNFPVPRDGFHESSAFFNFQYLLIVRKRNAIPMDIRRPFPWILWILWKNRNKFLFEGKFYSPPETIVKIQADCAQWFFSQSVENSNEEKEESCSKSTKSLWMPPLKDWLKYNIGVSWDMNQKVVGGAWVLRDAEANVRLHSRRSFVDVNTLKEAKTICFLWAFESIHSLNYDKVIFSVEAVDLVGATTRPKTWPFFSQQVAVILDSLHNFWIGSWKIFLGEPTEHPFSSHKV